ncbi:MAG: DNA polymerase IV [Thaumarchaeota archaeon]|nr:DNA polymerase IV [Nitrososphaerota archaeon]
MMHKIIMHIDLDYFFAQCEELRNPTIKTKPVVVCVFSNRGNNSGVVATSNYIARRYQVKSGIPIIIAKKKLTGTNAVFLKSDYHHYSRISVKIMNIIKKYADMFEYVGKDEAYLDISKTSNENYKQAELLAYKIKNKIFNETKLTCSIGVSHNKLLAKIASSYKKPSGLTIVKPENTNYFLSQLEISKIPKIGSKTIKKMKEMNIHTIYELKKLDIFKMNKTFGKKIGTYIHNSARGICNEKVKIKDINQISKIITLSRNSNEYEYILQKLFYVCKKLHEIIIKKNKLFKNVTIQLVQSNLTNKIVSKKLLRSTNDMWELKNIIKKLLKNVWNEINNKIRRVGIIVSDLSTRTNQEKIVNFF